MSKRILPFLLLFIAGFTDPASLSAQTISLYAGLPAGTAGYDGDGTGLTSYELNSPQGLCFDKNGNMYVCDNANNRIRKISGNVISTIAGTGTAGWSGDGGPATAAKINAPFCVAVDDNLNVFFTTNGDHRVREILASSANIITVAGTGTAGYNGDGSPATNYELNQPQGIAIGRDGLIYIGDQFNDRIRRLDPVSSTIYTWAGTGVAGFSGDGGPATAAKFTYPTWIKFDRWGDLFFWDREDERMRRITAGTTPAQNIISTVLGVGGVSGFVGDGGPATAAEFSYLPGGIGFDGAGNLYFADRSNYRIREIFVPERPGSVGIINGSDTVNTIAGTSTETLTGDGTGDGGPASAATFDLPIEVLLDSTGNYWIADPGRNVIRFVNLGNHRPHFANGAFQTLNVCENTYGDSIRTLLNVSDLDVNQLITWNIFKKPQNGVAYAFDTVRSNGGAISMTGAYYTPNENYSGPDTFWVWVNDGYSLDTTEIAVNVQSFYAGAVTTEPNIVCPGNSITLSDDTSGGAWSSNNTTLATVAGGVVTGQSAGNAYISYTISNSCGSTSSMAEITVGTPIITTIAGGGTSLGDGGPATAAQLNGPSDAITDGAGNIYIADFSNNRIRKINTSGVISTFAGTGTAGALGDGTAAVSAELNTPSGICFDAAGNMYIADYGNNKIRMVNTSGTISTYAGTGTPGYTGDGGAATIAELFHPSDVVMDSHGNLDFTDGQNCAVRAVSASGTIYTVAGIGTPGYSGDNGPATSAQLWWPFGIALDQWNNIYIADQWSNRIRKISNSGYISTVAGSGATGSGTGTYTGDNGQATAATLSDPVWVCLDEAGNIFVGDYSNNVIREVNNAGIITTVSGTGVAGYSGDYGPPTAAKMSAPHSVWVDGNGDLVITDYTNNKVRRITDTDPSVAAIGGPTSVCVGSSITLTDATTGEFDTWSNSNPIIAAVVPGTGMVTGVSAGTSVITYSVLFACGTLYSTQAVTVNPLPGPINNLTYQVCVGQSTTYTDGGTGTWSSENSLTASVGVGSGVVTGVAVGTTRITYTLAVTGCYTDTFITVANTPGPITGNTNVCVGLSTTLGDVGSGTWTSANPSVGSVTFLTGVVTGVSAGTVSITFTIGTGCYATTYVTVNPNPGAIGGSPAVCAGSTADLTSGSGGTWSTSNVAVGTITSGSGFFTGMAAGTASVTYTLSTGCLASRIETVNPLPAAIAGSFAICNGSSTTLTDATGGGSWTSVTTSVAIIGSLTGTITTVGTGTTLIEYILPTGCMAFNTETVTLAPGLVTGTNNVCVGSSTTLSDLPGGGTWSSSNLAVGTINSSGVLSGLSIGTGMITYSLGSGCIATTPFTVNLTPAALAGANHVCQGLTTVLTESTGGGAWSSSNASVASVTGGTVSGAVVGTAVISYTLSTGCNSTMAFTVNALPSGITGVTTICSGTSTTLSDLTLGGNWSSSNGSVATVVSGTGVTSGTGIGTASITYTLSTGCLASTGFTVNLTPAGILGASNVCVGNSTTLTDPTAGGTWVSSNGSVATVGSNTGSVTGVSAGVVNISYVMASGCYAETAFTVNASPSAIFGATNICVGASATFSDLSFGGNWTTSNGAVASVGGVTGLVTGVSAGTANITYTISAGCLAFITVTVNANPSAITPPTGVSVCPGGTTSLGDLTAGGTWSSSNLAVATVGTAGMVTGNLSGTVTISYTNSAGCAALKIVTVSIGPNAISPPNPTVCVGAVVDLSDVVGGGTWTSTNPAFASVGSSSGIVNGVANGTVIITYAIGSCYATTSINVTGLLSAGIITGPSAMCITTPINLLDGALGGAWISGNTAVANVGTSGQVTGVGAGTVIISYAVTNSCGTAVVTHTVTVSVLSAGIIVGAPTICAGLTTSYTDAAGGGIFTAANSTATISGAGLLVGVTPGTNIITYTVNNTCGVSATTKTITVGAFLTAGSITGPGSVCAGSSITLTDLAPGGLWSASNAYATVSGGMVTGVSGGVDTISYTVTSSCGSGSALHSVTVIPIPTAGSISGPAIICVGSPTTYTDAAPGGNWSVDNATATISGAGVVTPVSVGTNIITYNVTNPCGSAYTTQTLNIGALLTAGTILGSNNVCVGSSITLTDATIGGAWTASNGDATVTGGAVTGVTAGSVTISYTVTSGCGSVSATQLVAVNPLPVAGSITGPSTLCIGTSATFTDPATGGAWSMQNGTATVSGGEVTPVSVGSDIVSYTVTNGCGTAVASENITIGTAPTAGTISGPESVCTGTPINLFDGVLGGAWSASNSNATISGTGLVTGLLSGLDTISYTVISSCGTAATSYVVTVNLSADPGIVLGPSVICAGTFTIYTDSILGGTWSVTNSSATITGAGVLSALLPGTIDTVVYTVSNACGLATATKVVNIGALLTAGTVSGAAGVCQGSSITLTDGVSGGVWSSGDPAVATVSSGVVNGVTAGTATISYTVTLVCGSAAAASVVTVSPPAVAGSIGGPSTVCVGTFITLTDVATGGVWSSANGNASVIAGVVTGMSAGIDTIMYTVTNYCGTASTSRSVTVNPLPATGSISGSDNVCAGSSVTLTDSSPGGTWSSSSTSIATVGSLTGVVDGISGGTAVIAYTISGSCGASISTLTMTVNALPVSGTISGPSDVCAGSSITLTDASPGGVWGTTNGYATVAGGSVLGVTPGLDTIEYTVTNLCGASTAMQPVTVSVFPVVGTIAGPANVCLGTPVNYTDPASGGVWSSSNTAVAIIGSVTGHVDGLSLGTTNIVYTITNACGTANNSMSVAVDPTLTAGTIAGTDSVCPGSSSLLTDITSGGVWGASNPNATVSFGGLVTGVSAGLDTIYYSVTNSCGTVSATKDMVILPIPGPGIISGGSNVCIGASVTLTDPSVGGSWFASNANATVSGGVATGVSTGTDTIMYIVTNMCGTNTDSTVMTINPLPTVAAISGDASECLGTATTLHDATSGGAWSSNNTSIATIGAFTGIVTGVAAGTVTLQYSVTDVNGCINSASISDTVSIVPMAAPITGTMNVCAGAMTTLFNSVPGGVWTSEYLSLATVNPSTGVVSGVGAGTDKIYYTLINSCGSVKDSANVTVGAAPSAGTITAAETDICSGVTDHLTDGVAGGVWGSANTSIAIVSTSGVVTGITAGSVDITYKVTNLSGCSATASIVLNIGGASPTGSVSPVGSVTLCHGNYISLHVTASVGVTTYQWLRNGSPIAGAISSTYSANTAGSYSVEISNGTCSATIAGPTVAPPPTPVISFNTPDELLTGTYVSYQWFLNGSAITGANSSTYYFTTGGLYTVVVTDVNGCSDTSLAYAVAGVNAVNNVNNSDNIKLYPNPATNVLHIDAPLSVNVTILSVDGATLLELKNVSDIDISKFANGLYLVRIYDENNTLIKTVKFTKVE